MARQFYHTNRFTRGEVEPALFDRADVDFYVAACKRMRNWLPLPAGAVKRRPALTRGPSLTPGGGNTLLDAFLYGFSYAGTDYFLLLMLTEAGGNRAVRAAVYAADLTLEKDLGSIATISGTGGFSLAQNVCLAAVGPSVFIASQKFAPRRVFYNTTASEFQAETIVFYEELLGLATVTNGSATVSGEDSLFNEQLSAGNVIRIDGANYTISAIANNTSMTLTTNYTGLSKEVRLTRAKAAPFGAAQHPALCTFYQGRLLFFSTPARPVTMWASKAQDPYIILPGTVYDDAPIVYDLLADAGDQFLWVYATDRVFVGSRRMEGSIFSDQGSTFTAATFSFSKASSLGGAAAMPFATDTSVVFLSAERNQMFSVQYDLARQGFVNENLSTLAPHILSEGVVAMAYRPATSADFTPRVFTLKEDGTLAVATIMEGESVLAWSRLEPPLGMEFKAIAAGASEVAAAVHDTNTTEWFLSRMDFDVEAGYILDLAEVCAVTAGVATVTDPVLEGLDVVVVDPVLGNLGTHTVDTGGVDLTAFAGLSGAVTVGLAFTDEIILLPAVIQVGTGVILNQKRRVPRVMVSVNETRQVRINGRPLLPSTSVDVELTPQTGVFSQWGLGWTSQDELRIEGATIYPARVLSVTREVIT